MNNLYSTLNRSKKNTLPAPLVPDPPLHASLPASLPAPLVHAPLPAPLVPEKRIPPPPVNRKNKPEIIIFKDGIVEDLY